jgi:ubiquinone/menaquinone biosynthesis C-methylase UbiE
MSIPKSYIDVSYLDALAKLLVGIKQRSYEVMSVQRGDTVLDVGCGPGTDTLTLGHLVGFTGEVVGVDADQGMLAEADRRAAEAGMSGWVRHEQADAGSLPFEAGYFDACRSDRLFQHLHHPETVLHEMARVTRPGGRVVVVDTDYGTLVIDSPEIDVERRLARFRAEHMHRNGYSGRQLYRLFKRQNLADISVEIFPVFLTDYAVARQVVALDKVEALALEAGAVTAEELRRWRAGLEQAEADGCFFGSLSVVLVAGCIA